MLYVGNLITQYFAHISTKVETEILDAVVRKIYKVIYKLSLVQDALNSTITSSCLFKTNYKISK